MRVKCSNQSVCSVIYFWAMFKHCRSLLAVLGVRCLMLATTTTPTKIFLFKISDCKRNNDAIKWGTICSWTLKRRPLNDLEMDEKSPFCLHCTSWRYEQMEFHAKKGMHTNKTRTNRITIIIINSLIIKMNGKTTITKRY